MSDHEKVTSVCCPVCAEYVPVEGLELPAVAFRVGAITFGTPEYVRSQEILKKVQTAIANQCPCKDRPKHQPVVVVVVA